MLLVQSCASNIKNQIPLEKKYLIAEKIPIAEVFIPYDFNLKEKYLMISSRQTDTLLYFYSIPDLKYLGSGCMRGGGPGEYPSNHLQFGYTSNDKVYTWDTRLNIREVQLDASGHVFSKEKFKLKRFQILNHIYIINDEVLLYNDVDNLEIIKQDLVSASIMGHISLKKDGNKNPSFDSGRGKLIANDSVIVYLYAYQDRIDIYDLNSLERKKSIVSSGRTSRNISPGGKYNQYNINGIAGEKYFYSTYVTDQTLDRSYVIRAYDYNGKLYAEYSFDVFPERYAVDEKNGYIYGYNTNYENSLLRYKLN